MPRLKVTAAAERAIWGLVRWAIAAGGPARVVGEGVVDELRPPERPDVLPGQLALWVVDAEGLPERPWRLPDSTRFACRALACTVTARECAFRQAVSAVSRTGDTWRGQASEFPSCSARCAQGRGIAAALSPATLAEIREEAARHARHRGAELSPAQKAAQERARKRMEREGLLDPTPSLDGGPEPVAE